MSAQTRRLWADFWTGRRRAARLYDASPRLRTLELGPLEAPANALSARQLEVARAAACGAASVSIAAALDLAESTVATYLGFALGKMGLASAADLRMLVPASLAPDFRRAMRDGLPCPPDAVSRGRRVTFPLPRVVVPAELTAAECDVLRLTLEGLSNADIARARGASPRTVANQLSAVYSKLGVGSRRELDTAMLPVLSRAGART